MEDIYLSNNDPVNLKQTGKNFTTYKVTISIIFGLLGFAVNFYSLDYFPVLIKEISEFIEDE